MTLQTPWHHEPRKFLTDAQAAKLFLEHGGRCWKCKQKIGPTELARDWSVGHKLALELGGTNDWANLAPECCLCKPLVDAEDHKAAGHNRRAATRHVIPKSMKKKSALAKRPGMKFNWKQGRYVRETD
ncbi:HNH endonuclease [Hyphomicrobium sp. DY-1]|uniref:HNH endonuclease n=1 Tax=Hyphomicrobium sp. DY-1 TaxID=3075650 RepID=UPI0039C361E4